MAYRLGIDLGSTSVAVAVASDDAPGQLILVGGATQLPSTLYVTEDGSLLVGNEAVTRAAADPARAVIDPLRRLADDLPAFDDGTSFVAAESGVAALLAAALQAAVSDRGGPPSTSVVSYPVGWDDYQRSGLLRAAAEAGLPDASLVVDLEAAARQVVITNDPGPGTEFLIMDLGGGCCTVGLARRTPAGVELLASERSDHPSGADFDEAVFRLVGGNLGDRGRELTRDDPSARARAREVREACRAAKEILSTAPEASVTVEMSGLSKTVRIGRAEFESLVRPTLRDALTLANRLLQRSGVAPTDLIGLALVGGASRMPVVAELVEREWELPVVVSPAPEQEVALGLAAAPGLLRAAAVAPSSVVAPGPEAAPMLEPMPEPVPTPASEPVPSPSPGPAPVPPAAAAPATDAPPFVTPVVEPASASIPVDEYRAAPPTTPMSPSHPPSSHPPPDTIASGPQAAASTTEQPMPENLIFDYFAATPTEPLPAVAAGSAAASGPRSPQLAASMPTPPQRPGGPYPQGQRPVPPGQRPVPPGQRPGPPTQAYGAGGGRPGGPGGYPPQPGGSGGSSGSRRNLILMIIGALVLVGAAVGIGFWLAKPGTTTGTPTTGGQISAPPVSTSPSGSAATPGGTPVSGSPSAASPSSGGSPASPSGGPSTGNTLPTAAPLGPNLLVVPMRTDDDDADARPLYLVDSTGAAKPQALPGPDGRLSNPMLQKDRSSIVFLENGVLRVMASDGSGERDLADREPAGCDDVAGASWSQADPTTLVISCRLGKNDSRLLVVDATGKLIRRLDAGSKRFDDVTVSPDGQTVLYWASDSTVGDGGSLYTLPLVGTGSAKKITSGAKGLDGDPSWSPDGSQIAFRRLVGGAGGNADVYVMNADGSGQRAVADTKAADVKPIWSPDGKNLVIISNRKSAFGKAGKTWDLWLTRVGDGEVIDNFDLKADEITTPTWSYR